MPWYLDPTSAIKTAAVVFWDLISYWLSLPIDFNRLSIVQYLYGNAWTVALQISGYVFVGIFAISLLYKRMRINGALSFLQVVTLPITVALWFEAAQQLQNLGDMLRKFAAGMNGGPQPTTSVLDLIPGIPEIESVLGLILFGLLLFCGIYVYFTLIGYAFLNVGLTILGLYVYAMSGLGERTRTFFSFIVSLFLVSAVVGVPVILMLTKFAEGMSNFSLNGASNSAETIAFICIAVFVGMALQPILVFIIFKPVNHVMGKVVANVEKPIRSISENKQRLEAKLMGRQNATTSFRYDRSRYMMDASLMASMSALERAKNQSGAKAATAIRNQVQSSKARKVAGTTATGLGFVAKVVPHPVVKTAAAATAAGLGYLANRSPKKKNEEKHDQ